ncbi:hypothetical protein SASPL_133202 [Salvia splendens]|uniref:Uncharacterized protein n=1 Tax=Salvia splendens TaxID=180675 RepID=A0A8X8X2H7_SALSN|nr:hypothetical protein SASPL_133202 [Salvia splendens]
MICLASFSLTDLSLSLVLLRSPGLGRSLRRRRTTLAPPAARRPPHRCQQVTLLLVLPPSAPSHAAASSTTSSSKTGPAAPSLNRARRRVSPAAVVGWGSGVIPDAMLQPPELCWQLVR